MRAVAARRLARELSRRGRAAAVHAGARVLRGEKWGANQWVALK